VNRWIVAVAFALAGCTEGGAEAPVRWAVTVNQVTFLAEVVDTPAAMSRGLMYRTELPERHGMLFVFPDEAPRAFWMKNTLLPLDIIFINGRREIVKIQRAVPCEQAPCARYPSYAPARYVLEINGGLSEALGIVEGARVDFSPAPVRVPVE
jgi:uncharacterized membrane protein (UPF0127 family)